MAELTAFKPRNVRAATQGGFCMIRSLLIALDGSDRNTALDLGLRWASRSGASAVGLGIVDTPGILRPEALPPGTTEFKRRRDAALLAEAGARVRASLDRFELRCTEAGVAFRSIEDEGDPAEQIVRHAQRCDLILMDLHGNFHPETRDVDDDTLVRVVRDGPRPVVAVPEPLTTGDVVLVAYDGSLQAARALAAFVSSGLGQDREVRLVCVDPDPAAAQEILRPAIEYLESHQIHSRIDAAQDARGNPAQVILERAGAPDVGLVVMGAYGQPRIREFLIGSVTRDLMQQSPRPLFLYH